MNNIICQARLRGSADESGETSDAVQRNLELMILAAARAEVLLARDKRTRNWIQQFANHGATF